MLQHLHILLVSCIIFSHCEKSSISQNKSPKIYYISSWSLLINCISFIFQVARQERVAYAQRVPTAQWAPATPYPVARVPSVTWQGWLRATSAQQGTIVFKVGCSKPIQAITLLLLVVSFAITKWWKQVEKWLNPFTAPPEPNVCYFHSFENNLRTKRKFTKCLKESCSLASDEQFSFICFQENAFVSNIFPNLSGLFWLVWVLMG